MRKTLSAAGVTLTLLAALAVVLSLIALPKRLAFDAGENYVFYLGDTSKDCRTVYASARTAPTLRLALNGINGESTSYRTLDAEEFIGSLGGEIVFTEELSDSFNYYCRAPLPYRVIICGEEINLHVCVKEDGVTVASPVIFGGY